MSLHVLHCLLHRNHPRRIKGRIDSTNEIFITSVFSCRIRRPDCCAIRRHAIYVILDAHAKGIGAAGTAFIKASKCNRHQCFILNEKIVRQYMFVASFEQNHIPTERLQTSSLLASDVNPCLRRRFALKQAKWFRRLGEKSPRSFTIESRWNHAILGLIMKSSALSALLTARAALPYFLCCTVSERLEQLI